MHEVPDPAPAVTALYRRLAPRLRRILAASLEAPETVLEDACQMAWTAWLGEQADRADLLGLDEGQVLSWLATTARRETLHMLRRAEFESKALAEGPRDSRRDQADPQCSAEFWDRLSQIRRLSRSQQQMLWLQGAGYGYREIATRVGASERSVERQLSRARRQLAVAA